MQNPTLVSLFFFFYVSTAYLPLHPPFLDRQQWSVSLIRDYEPATPTHFISGTPGVSTIGGRLLFPSLPQSQKTGPAAVRADTFSRTLALKELSSTKRFEKPKVLGVETVLQHPCLVASSWLQGKTSPEPESDPGSWRQRIGASVSPQTLSSHGECSALDQHISDGLSDTSCQAEEGVGIMPLKFAS